MFDQKLRFLRIASLCWTILGLVIAASHAEDSLSLHVQTFPIRLPPISATPDGQFVAFCDRLKPDPVIAIYRVDQFDEPVRTQVCKDATLLPILFASTNQIMVGPYKSLQVQETVSGKVLHQFSEPLYPLIRTKMGVLAKEVLEIPDHEHSRLVLIDFVTYEITRLGEFEMEAEAIGDFCFDEGRQRLYNAMMYGRVSEFDISSKKASLLCRLTGVASSLTSTPLTPLVMEQSWQCALEEC